MRMVSGGQDRTLRVWDLAAGDLDACLQAQSEICAVSSISSDGRFVAGTWAGEVLFMNPLNLVQENGT